MATSVTTPDAVPGQNIPATWGDAVRADLTSLLGDTRVYWETDGATVTFNQNNGRIQGVILGGNRTLAVSNLPAGNNLVFFIVLKQDGTGGRTVTWFSGISWAFGGTAPVLTTGINKYDVFGFIQVGSGSYIGVTIAQNA